jgi:hypothetical protein
MSKQNYKEKIRAKVKKLTADWERKRKTRIYIAGKVTGEDKFETIVKFQKAADQIKAMGFHPVNPLEVVGTWDITWKDAMKTAIKSMLDCDAVFLLPCSSHSKGARIELSLAFNIDIPLFTEFEKLKKFKR